MMAMRAAILAAVAALAIAGSASAQVTAPGTPTSPNDQLDAQRFRGELQSQQRLDENLGNFRGQIQSQQQLNQLGSGPSTGLVTGPGTMHPTRPAFR